MRGINYAAARLPLLALALLCGACANPGPQPPPQATPVPAAERVLQAYRQATPWPALSRSHDIRDVAQAYAVQGEYLRLRLRQDRIAGYKAGLSGAGSAARFGLRDPVSGVLLQADRIHPDSAGVYHLKENPAVRLMLELEVALIFATAPRHPPTTVAELRRHIGAVAPAIEIPGIAFSADGVFSGADLIASNVAARRFLLGESHPLAALKGLQLRELEARLFRAGQLLTQGRGSDAMGGPWNAALWLTRHMMARGWRPAPGEALLGGVLGSMIPAEAGAYRADFGALGTLHLEIHNLNQDAASTHPTVAQ